MGRAGGPDGGRVRADVSDSKDCASPHAEGVLSARLFSNGPRKDFVLHLQLFSKFLIA